MRKYLKPNMMQIQALCKWLCLIAAGICAVLYGLAIYRLAVNAPFGDDFDAILGFLNTYQGSSPSSYLNLFFAQHNEHRIVLSKIIQTIYFTIFGKINFSHLIWIGNVAWFATIYLLWRYSKKCGITLYQFAPVIIVLLTFTHYNLMTWAMASIALYYQILFACLTLYAMVSHRPLLALGFFLIGLFTGGGGIAVAPLLLLFYALQRQWRLFVLALITAISGLCIYFLVFPYVSPTGHAHPLSNLLHPELMLQYFFVFLGGFVKESPLVSGVCGVLIAGLLVKYTKSIYKNSPYLWWVALFIFCIAGMLSITRSGFGIEQATSSRYSQYSLLIISILYLSYLMHCTTARSRLLATGAGLLFAVILFKTWYPLAMENMRERSQILLQNPLKTYYDAVNGQRILDKSKALGIFELTPNPKFRGID